MGHKVNIYTNMLRSFLADVQTMGDELESLLPSGDTATAQRLLHTIKGLAATLGVTLLSKQAASAEKQLKSRPNDPSAFSAELVQGLRQSIQLSHHGLQDLLRALDGEVRASATSGSTSASPGNSNLARKALEEMAAQLQTSDMQAMETMTKVELHWPPSSAEALAALQAAMAGLEFELALLECRKLLDLATNTA